MRVAQLPARVILLLAAAAVLIVPAGPAPAQLPVGWPDIVFTQYLDAMHLYGVMADASYLDRLLLWPQEVECEWAVWSPDRRTLAYQSANRGSLGEPDGVYALDLDMSEERLLFASSSARPRQWSPDGERLLVTEEAPGYHAIWAVDSDGSGADCLNDPLLGYLDDQPRWSADGAAVIFRSDRSSPGTAAGQHIWKMNPDGSSPVKLTSGNGPCGSPYPSPDGWQIAFVRTVSGTGHIYAMDPDGSDVLQLTSASYSDLLPTEPWSPDCRKLLFARSLPGNDQMFVMNRDGSGQTDLSPGDPWEHPDDWSPDGTKILFSVGDQDPWVMNANGTGRIRLSPVSACWGGTWRARGIRRVYLPKVKASPGSNLTLSLNVDTCDGVAGFQARIDYDPAMLECTGVVKGALLQGTNWSLFSPNIDNTAGNVRFIAYDAGLTPLPPGHGELFRLSFHVKSGAPAGATSPLHFSQCLVSDENGDPILMTPVDGAVTTPTVDYQLSLFGTHGQVEVNGTPHSLPWSATYPSGSSVSLLAVPDPGYQFTGWTGDLVSTNNPVQVTMNSAKSITANFSPSPCSVTILGSNGHVVVDGAPHDLPWSAQYPCGTSLPVTAVADTCYGFSGWTGDIVSSLNPVSIEVNGDLIVTANFSLLVYTLSLDKTGNGAVRTDGVLRALPWAGQYGCGATVDLEAVPEDEHWAFDHWSGDLSGSQNPTSILIGSPKTVIANFLAHTISLSVSADPEAVWPGGQSQLAAQCSDSLGHSTSKHWREITVPPSGPGTFSPSPDVANPLYTAPDNPGDSDLVMTLECTATCDSDPRISQSVNCTVTVRPCATMGAVDSNGGPGATARVPVVLDLKSLSVDRFAFSARVTPLPGAPALGGMLGFESAPGIPAPGLVSPSGETISVAWFTPLAQPVTGTVVLGDMLVPLSASVELGDAYSICMTNVGASLGPDEICAAAGECATLTGCGRLLVSDAYPVVGDHNSDSDSCDLGEFGNNGLTWGDVITVFDAWAVPGSFPCGPGTLRRYAMDSYPRDADGAPGGDGAISWGDIITTFDRWADPGLARPWRTICDPEVAPLSELAPRPSSMTARAAASSPLISVAGGSGELGSVVRLAVTIEPAGQPADRVGFVAQIVPVGGSPAGAELAGFEPAAGLPQPMVETTVEGGLAVAWLTPMPSALSGAATLGDLKVSLPGAAAAGSSWLVRLTGAGASLGGSELDPPTAAGADATIMGLPAVPHDVVITRFQAPSRVKAGDSKRLVIELENRTSTAETVTVRLLRAGAVSQSLTVDLKGAERRRLQVEYTFTEQDKPSVELRVEAVLPRDSHPEDNAGSATVLVR